MIGRRHAVLMAALAATLLLAGCETVEWWMAPENRAWAPSRATGRVFSGILALIAIPFVLYAIYKGSYDDRPGSGGGGWV